MLLSFVTTYHDDSLVVIGSSSVDRNVRNMYCHGQDHLSTLSPAKHLSLVAVDHLSKCGPSQYNVQSLSIYNICVTINILQATKRNKKVHDRTQWRNFLFSVGWLFFWCPLFVKVSVSKHYRYCSLSLSVLQSIYCARILLVAANTPITLVHRDRADFAFLIDCTRIV